MQPNVVIILAVQTWLAVGTDLAYSKRLFRRHFTPPNDIFYRNWRYGRPKTLNRPCSLFKCLPVKKQRNRSRFYDRLFHDYDNRMFPSNKTVKVKASIFVNSIDSISESSFDYNVAIFLRLSWTDKRLAFDPVDIDGEHICDIAESLQSKLWKPDLYITNEKRVNHHMVTIPNQLVQLTSDGLILCSRRYTASIHCQMELHAFPFDTQHCDMGFESFAYSDRHLSLDWSDTPLEVDHQLSVPQFTIKTISFKKVIRVTERGNVSSLVVMFEFSRDVGFYILQIYLPTLFIVLTSFIAFWVDPLAVPARVTISVFTTLIMATMSFSIRETMPLVSYIKAIDIWILACMFFVTLALLEYAVVNVLFRQRPRGIYLLSILEATMATIPSAIHDQMAKALGSSPEEPEKLKKTKELNRALHIAETFESVNPEIHDVLQQMRSLTNFRQRRRAVSYTTPCEMETMTEKTVNEKKAESIPGLFELTITSGGIFNKYLNAISEDNELNDNDSIFDDEKNVVEKCWEHFMNLLLRLPFWRRFCLLNGVQRVEVLESACRYIFPLGFLFFNVTYWLTYVVILKLFPAVH